MLSNVKSCRKRSSPPCHRAAKYKTFPCLLRAHRHKKWMFPASFMPSSQVTSWEKPPDFHFHTSVQQIRSWIPSPFSKTSKCILSSKQIYKNHWSHWHLTVTMCSSVLLCRKGLKHMFTFKDMLKNLAKATISVYKQSQNCEHPSTTWLFFMSAFWINCLWPWEFLTNT